MAAARDRVVTVFGGTGSLGEFGIFVCTTFAFGLHQGTRTAVAQADRWFSNIVQRE